MPEKQPMFWGRIVHTDYPEIKDGRKTGKTVVVIREVPDRGPPRPRLVVDTKEYRSEQPWRTNGAIPTTTEIASGA